MSIDMTQFLQTFYEESFEGLEIMEAELLNLDLGDFGQETINTIFRAAHSIKGGAGTFGLQEVAAFTHVMETLLDEVRSNQRSLDRDLINLLLHSADCVKSMLVASKNAEDYDREEVQRVQKALEQVIGTAADGAQEAGAGQQDSAGASTQRTFKIDFRPGLNLLKTGNDPLRLFRELEELGELEVKVCDEDLPVFSEYISDECYLSWKLRLSGNVQQSQIEDVFTWVEDECELHIEEVRPETADSAQTEAVARQAVDGTAKTAERRQKVGKIKEQNSIRVGIDKVDSLINMVGELVITQSMLGQLGKDFEMGRLDRLLDGLAQLERNTRELQESVMRIRMLPISFAFNRFPRLVHDLNQQLGKKVELRLCGEQTELDKTVLEKIVDPLVHLVRNSVDHGIELPAQRVAKGKPETGVVELNAYHKGGNIVIEISDDGAGLDKDRIKSKALERGLIGADDELTDEQIYDLIFQPGFSTADKVSDVSGRGVGMDVVRKNIRALSGVVEVRSVPDQGSVFTIKLPLTLAIMDGQLIQIGDQIYIVPLVSIIESLQIKEALVNSITDKACVYKLRDDYIEIIPLYKVFDIEARNKEVVNGLLVVVEADGKKVGLLVDDLLDQQQVVIKSLETNYKRVGGISGATILGDGTVAMILDIQGLVELAHSKRSTADGPCHVSQVA